MLLNYHLEFKMEFWVTAGKWLTCCNKYLPLEVRLQPKVTYTQLIYNTFWEARNSFSLLPSLVSKAAEKCENNREWIFSWLQCLTEKLFKLSWERWEIFKWFTVTIKNGKFSEHFYLMTVQKILKITYETDLIIYETDFGIHAVSD